VYVAILRECCGNHFGENFLKKDFPQTPFKNFSMEESFLGRFGNTFFQKRVSNNNFATVSLSKI